VGIEHFILIAILIAGSILAKSTTLMRPAGREARQLHGNHSDHLVAMVETNLTKLTPYVVMARYTLVLILLITKKERMRQPSLVLMTLHLAGAI
jgi:mannose/fructose/N-acetylgalactosamine-specific phosphotransferase system component IID